MYPACVGIPASIGLPLMSKDHLTRPVYWQRPQCVPQSQNARFRNCFEAVARPS